MIKQIKNTILTLGVLSGMVLVTVPASVSAIDIFPACNGTTDSSLCKETKSEDSFGNFIKVIVNTLLYVLGAVAVVTIIVSGVRYTTSHGDPKSVQVAKDTMLYAVVGLIVAVTAFAVVNFVTGILPN